MTCPHFKIHGWKDEKTNSVHPISTCEHAPFVKDFNLDRCRHDDWLQCPIYLKNKENISIIGFNLKHKKRIFELEMEKKESERVSEIAYESLEEYLFQKFEIKEKEEREQGVCQFIRICGKDCGLTLKYWTCYHYSLTRIAQLKMKLDVLEKSVIELPSIKEELRRVRSDLKWMKDEEDKRIKLDRLIDRDVD
jgi:hypothetical protein